MNRIPSLFRRIKAALRMGATWALGWAGFAILLAVVPSVVSAAYGQPTGVSYLLIGVGLAGAIGCASGFVAGTSFSVVLGMAERRHTFDELSITRFAAWGALGGLVLAAAISLTTNATFESIIGVPPFLQAGIAWASLGAGSAAASLVIARRTEARSALDSGEEAVVAGGIYYSQVSHVSGDHTD